MTVSGVSVVIPVHNGRRTLPAVLQAIFRECAGRPFEVIAVEDGSSDPSLRYLQRLERAGRVRTIRSAGRGIAAAINTGLREARYPLIAQVDQDVVVEPGWLETLCSAVTTSGAAAAQGQYVTAPRAGFWARMMGRDLELRYSRIRGTDVDHVCTGNTVYRASALHGIGLFDEALGYGCDNDVSYRLLASGHRLAYRPGARAVHLWRETATGYLRQQFGVAYGRLDLIAKHPARVGGDAVSGALMILHAPLMLGAVLLGAAACLAPVVGLDPAPFAGGAALFYLPLFVERLAAGISAWRRSGDRAALAFPVAHSARDLAWALAILVWATRRVRRVARSPEQSMPRRTGRAQAEGSRIYRTAGPGPGGPAGGAGDRPRVLVLIPAFNERLNLERVVSDLRQTAPAFDVLVVNDGSTDETPKLLPQLGVEWISLPVRVGVGGAVRTGLRFAQRRGYRYVVRIDGDGQHRARDAARLVGPVIRGQADVALGSRYLASRRALRGPSKSALSILLTILTRHRVTDPTSGCWAFGPAAIRLLARLHPTGYPEPELLLLLHRHGLRVEEVPMRSRPRQSGRTSLTSGRKAVALTRTILAMLMVPMRGREQPRGIAGD